MTVEEWNIFTRRWDVFRSGSGIDELSAASQLFQCAETELGDSLLKSNPNIAEGPLSTPLDAMRALAIIPVATCVLRTELLQLRQERDEPCRAFAAKVRGKAETCNYVTNCTCGDSVDYTDNIIRDVILNGLYDMDIRREVLGVIDILEKPVNDVVALVESKEMARNALPSPSMSAMSSFQKQRKQQPTIPSQKERERVACCPDCHKEFKLFSEGVRGWNETPHKVCIECYRANRRRSRQQRQPQQRSPQTPNINAVDSDQISQIAVIYHESNDTKKRRRKRGRRQSSGTHVPIKQPPTVRLDHHIFTKGEWKRARLRNHPRVLISVSLARTDDCQDPAAEVKHAKVSAIADTGAQSDLWSLNEFLACGFSREDLHPISLSMSAANHTWIPIEGAFFAKLAVQSENGPIASCHSWST